MRNFINGHNDNVTINDVILGCHAEGILVSACCSVLPVSTEVRVPSRLRYAKLPKSQI